ncbi:MAG: hypothetical protein WBW54_26175, partial [Candidatus Acidiferrales bacterium]
MRLLIVSTSICSERVPVTGQVMTAGDVPAFTEQQSDMGVRPPTFPQSFQLPFFPSISHHVPFENFYSM